MRDPPIFDRVISNLLYYVLLLFGGNFVPSLEFQIIAALQLENFTTQWRMQQEKEEDIYFDSVYN